jgi:hypothetical protein
VAAATDALLDKANFPTVGRRIDAVNGVIDHLLEKGPSAATDWFKQLPKGKVRELALTRLAQQWSQTDPASAMAWLQKQPDSDARNTALDQAATQWSGQEPQAAMAYAAMLPAGTRRDDLMTKGLGSWAQTDGKAAWAWAQSQPAGAARDKSQLAVVTNWAQSDPAAAASQLQTIKKVEESPEDKERRELSSEISFHGGFFSDRPPLEAAYAGVTKTWVTVDPAQAASWLGQLPKGAPRDAAVESYSETLIREDPRTAVQMAASIQDGTGRKMELGRLISMWASRDRSQAIAAAEGLPLPDDEKTDLLKRWMP